MTSQERVRKSLGQVSHESVELEMKCNPCQATTFKNVSNTLSIRLLGRVVVGLMLKDISGVYDYADLYVAKKNCYLHTADIDTSSYV